MRRIIREEEPAKPSTRLSTLGPAAATVSQRRQSDPKRLSQLLRGELDWIVMKALEKDRTAALRDGQRLRGGRAALSARRAGGGLPAVGLVSLSQVRSAAQGGAVDSGGGSPGVALGVGGVSWALWDQLTRRAETERTVNGALVTMERLRDQAGDDAEEHERRGGSNRGSLAASGGSAGPGVGCFELRNRGQPAASAGAGPAAGRRTATGRRRSGRQSCCTTSMRPASGDRL